MPLPSVDEFIGPDVTQQGFKDAQKNMLEYISDELPTKTDLETEVSAVELKIQPKADKTYVDTALASFQNGAIKTYPTLAAANADIANIAINTKVSVLSEVDGGDYYKATADATTLTKSPYDPLVTGKGYTDNQVQKKQNTVNADTLTAIDFSAYLKVGNVGTTGLLENTNFANRRSIINYPVDLSKFYLIRNTSDLQSTLRIAWFDSSNVLLSVVAKSAGQMADLLLTPVANAAFLSITLKSGSTDATIYDASKVAFYSSTSADLGISKINNWNLRDSRVDALQADVALNNDTIRPTLKYSGWQQYGLSSTGGLNTTATQSHLEYIAVSDNDVLTSTEPMYRISFYDKNKTFISQTSASVTSYTIPANQNIAYIRVASQLAATSNTTVVSLKSYLSEISKLKKSIEANTADIVLNQNSILSKQDNIKPESVTVIDFSAYLKNGNIDANTGLLVNTTSTRRRAIVDYPVMNNLTYKIKNTADLLSSLDYSFFDSDKNLISVTRLAAGLMSDFEFTPPSNAAFFNCSIKSGATDSVVYDSSKVAFYSSTDGKFVIEQINGFDLAGGASEALETRIESLEKSAVKNVLVGGTFALKNGNDVTIESASAQKSGLMSAADKAKLDSLINGTITINGSGVTKNAAAYGFLPTNNATQNVVAMKAAVTGGGTIIVDYPGVYDVNETIALESNTAILFGAKVYINKVSFDGKSPKYTFINKGAYTREWNENIILKGLKIICNGIGNGTDGTSGINGLRGHVAMFYIRNLWIDNFEILDGDAQSYVLHICTFQNIKITNSYIEGYKDAVHLGNGDSYLIRDCRFKTYDDPIALNCHDYANGQPEMGSLTNGLIENCYDLEDPDRGTTGFFARILAGAWGDWFAGMEVQQADTVVASNGKMYRVNNGVTNPVTYYNSTIEPNHPTGTVTYSDGIKWTMAQDQHVSYAVGVRNVTFRDIYLQKPRPVGLSVYFGKDRYSRSYYPNSELPIQDGIVFDGLHQQAEIPTLLSVVTPLKTIKIINSDIGDTKINLTNLGTDGMTYEPVNILMMGNTFKGNLSGQQLISTATGRTAKVKILGSIKENDSYSPTFGSGVIVQACDL